MAPSGPELNTREQAPVTAGQTATGAGVGEGTESPGGIPGLGALGGTLRKHGYVALSILTMTSWVSQRAPRHINLDFEVRPHSLLIVQS